MKVILKQDLTSLGKKNEIKIVATGYARNFLIPKGIAVPATAEEMKKLEREKTALAEMAKKERMKIEALAAKLKNLILTITAKAASPQGKLFGSLGSREIASELKKQGFEEILPEMIKLTEPIKQTGEFSVELKLGEDLRTKIKIVVEGNDQG